MKQIYHLIILISTLALFLTGCAGAINQKEAEIHFDAAQQYEFSGDYNSAREQYWKALVNANLAGADKGTISMLMYNFGRMTGFTCHLDEAEKYLQDSLELEKTVTGPESGITSMRIFELARLNYDRKRYSRSSQFYEMGLPILEKLEMEKKDPIALANIMDEYADTLSEIGNKELATTTLANAKRIRNENSGKEAIFVPTRYKCAQPKTSN